MSSLAHLDSFTSHPNCGDAARGWYRVATRASWSNLVDVRRSFQSTDQVGRVLIFNLRGNAYRLITTAHFASKTLYVKALLSHAEYDRKEWVQWV